MDTNYLDSISFSARLKNYIKIRKYDSQRGKYLPLKVSFVEIDSKEDLPVLENIAKYWSLFPSFTDDIYDTARGYLTKKDSDFYKNSKVYALTTQLNNFKSLDENSILGIVDVANIRSRKINIMNIQANPNIIYNIFREFKGIGTGILKSLKLYNDSITLRSRSNYSVRKFYKKNDFSEAFEKNFFYWESTIVDKIKSLFSFLYKI